MRCGEGGAKRRLKLTFISRLVTALGYPLYERGDQYIHPRQRSMGSAKMRAERGCAEPNIWLPSRGAGAYSARG